MARVTTRTPYNVRCSYSAKQLFSEVQERDNRCVLSMFLKVDNVGAERRCSGRLYQATGPATQNAHLMSCSIVLGPGYEQIDQKWHSTLLADHLKKQRQCYHLEMLILFQCSVTVIVDVVQL